MNGDQPNNMFQPGMNAPERKSSMVSTIVVILIVVLAVIYLLASRSSAPATDLTPGETPATGEGVLNTNPTTPNEADELNQLEAELNNPATFSETDDSFNQLEGELIQ